MTLRITTSEYDALATMAELRGWFRAGRPVVSRAARILIREGLIAMGLMPAAGKIEK